VKQTLAARLGVSRFRQQLFHPGDAEIPDHEVFTSYRFSWSWNFAYLMPKKTKR
jgi:hypothetical protein